MQNQYLKIIMNPSNSPSTVYDWRNIDKLVDIIFDRQYYTNHGPELNELENELESFYPESEFLGMANYDIAFLISLISLDTGRIIGVPSIIENSVLQALKFLNYELEVLPVNPMTGVLSLNNYVPSKTKKLSTLIVSNLFGNTFDYQELYDFVNTQNVSVIILSKDGFGIKHKLKWSPDLNIIEIFDFSKTSMINGGVGAGVRTVNKALSEKLRNIRSSYGARKKTKIPFTGNGRMSEMQAGLIRISLASLESKRSQNKNNFDLFRSLIHELNGCHVTETNHKFSTIPYFSKLITNVDEAYRINMKSNQMVNPSICRIKTPSDLDITILSNEINAKIFMERTIVFIISPQTTRFQIEEVIREFKTFLNIDEL